MPWGVRTNSRTPSFASKRLSERERPCGEMYRELAAWDTLPSSQMARK